MKDRNFRRSRQIKIHHREIQSNVNVPSKDHRPPSITNNSDFNKIYANITLDSQTKKYRKKDKLKSLILHDSKFRTN